MAPAPDLDDLVATVVAEAPSDEPLDRLAAAATMAQSLTALADELVGHFIDEARQRGCSWAQVGREIGITKQAAHQRHGHRHDGPHRHGSARGATLLNSAFGKLELATPRVRMVLAEAEGAAHRRHHNWLGTEHLLEGVLALPESVGARALAQLGVTAEAVTRAIDDDLPDGNWPPGPVPVTPRARRVLRNARREAKRAGHRYIGTEHIVIALAESEGLAAEVLQELGVSADALREEVLHLLSGHDKA